MKWQRCTCYLFTTACIFKTTNVQKIYDDFCSTRAQVSVIFKIHAFWVSFGKNFVCFGTMAFNEIV
jgi:hypothetical protein